MPTNEQIRELKQAGEEVRRGRDDREDHGGRTAEEVKRLREAAAETAAVCADCFTALAPEASVTLVGRWSHHTPASYSGIGTHIPAHDHWLDVPICLSCWLQDIATPWWGNMRGLSLRGRDWEGPVSVPTRELRRHRCEGCSRPMRIEVPESRRWSSRGLSLRERCCCAQCLRQATLRRANERRRVRHAEMACAACGEMFIPTQSTAKTCSNRCRQKLHRERAAAAD
jgi:hypothetical protein